MRYYAITDSGVVSARTQYGLNRKMKGSLETAEFKYVGSDAVVILTAKDLEFVQDKKRLSQIPISRLYKSDNTVKLLIIFLMLMQFVVMVKSCGMVPG